MHLVPAQGVCWPFHAVMLLYRVPVLQEAGRTLLPLCERSSMYKRHGLYTDALGFGGAVGVGHRGMVLSNSRKFTEDVKDGSCMQNVPRILNSTRRAC